MIFHISVTDSQRTLIIALSHFILDPGDRKLFILKGYAGTGKTTVVGSLVKNLRHVERNAVLLAPTGRAAKVLTSYSGTKAYTIHKHIYMLTTGIDGSLKLTLAFNKYRNCIFIVDEASMIPDSSGSNDSSFFSSRNLLEDLINYVYSGKNCKLILIGDTAQLPPVGIDESPALNLDYLKNSFHLDIETFELREVVRQALDSGILTNATLLRQALEKNSVEFNLVTGQFSDIIRINGTELEDQLNNAFSVSGIGETVVITRSNKRANIFNREIRNRILFHEGEISTGDYLMVVRNNYFWIDKKSPTGFIANGDILEIMKIMKYEELYGFRFADIMVRLTDYPEEKDLTVKILLDTISSDGPALTSADNRRLFDEIMKDYDEIPSKRSRMDKVKNNPYFNALQVKYAYALTCHKTQGGQWERVFIDQGYLTDEQINKEYSRWLYTAVTRATSVLYLVNFNEKFFTK